MAFDYVISLDLDGRDAVVVGGGEEAVGRVEELVHVGARLTVIAAHPHDRLRELAAAGRLTLHERGYRRGDLAGAFLVIATREEPMDTTALWEESREVGALTTVLDENEHCDYAQPALVRRGDLRIAIATAGRAPALAKRLRRRLEAELGDDYATLIDVIAEARAAAVPRTVPFGEWAARWERALADLDGLVALVAAGRRAEAREAILAEIRDPAPATPPSTPTSAPGPTSASAAGPTSTSAAGTTSTGNDDHDNDDHDHLPPVGQERA